MQVSMYNVRDGCPAQVKKWNLEDPKAPLRADNAPAPQHLHQTRRRLLKRGQEATLQNSENKEEVLEAKDKMFMLEREDGNPLRSR